MQKNMFKYINTFPVFSLKLLLLFNFLQSESGYNTIYLMEFDNLRNDFTNNNLKTALPDLIKENYKFREDIRVEYAGDIRPYLEKNLWTEEDSIKGLIVSGSFQKINNEFSIDYEAYDIHSWKQLVNRQIVCPMNDVICIHDAFLISIEKNISPFLADDLDLQATIDAIKKEKPKRHVEKQEIVNETNLDDNSSEREFLLNKHIDDIPHIEGEYGNRYYREFNIKNLAPDLFTNISENTEKLLGYFDNVLSEPYDVKIGELSVNVSPNKELLSISLPIQYSLKNILKEKLRGVLPYNVSDLESGSTIIKFSKKDYNLDENFLESLEFNRTHIMPVIFFNNKIGQVQFIILDSWHEKYQLFKPKNVSLLLENHFKPLYSITPNEKDIQLLFDSKPLEIKYNFTIPYGIIGDYTKVTVKFMKESELDELLE